MFSSSCKVILIAFEVIQLLLLFRRESTCTFVLLQISKTKPWKCTPQQRVIHKKFLFSICNFLRYFLKNGIPIPSTIGDMHASTPVLLKLRLDNTWSTVNVSVKKFWSWHLSRVNPIYSVVCEVTDTASVYRGCTQRTFQRRFNVVFRLIWRRDVAQRQSNVETTLSTSTLKFTTLNNVETTLYISTLNWTTLDNVETTLSFSTSISQC